MPDEGPASGSRVGHEPTGQRYSEVRRHLGRVQKSGRGAPAYSRWINRPLGRSLAAAAYLLGMTPNQVTAVSAACTFTALALVGLVTPVWWLGVLVAGLLVLGYGLDAADGQLARLRGGGSRQGEFFDHVVDATKVCLLHTMVFVSFYRFGVMPPALLFVPLAYQVVSSVFFFAFILVDQLRKAHRPAGAASTPGGSGLLQTLLAIPTDYATLCVCFTLLGWRDGFPIVYALLFAANAVLLLGALARWWREMGRMDLKAG